jgi:hypothetical protein
MRCSFCVQTYEINLCHGYTLSKIDFLHEPANASPTYLTSARNGRMATRSTFRSASRPITGRPDLVSARSAAYDQRMAPHFGALRDLLTLLSHSVHDCGGLLPPASRTFGACGDPLRGARRGVRSQRNGKNGGADRMFFDFSLTFSYFFLTDFDFSLTILDFFSPFSLFFLITNVNYLLPTPAERLFFSHVLLFFSHEF